MNRRKVSRGVVPYKRNLFETVQQKAVHGDWHQRGYLPHRSQVGLVQFVTFRLADSLPSEFLRELEIEVVKRNRRKRTEEMLDGGIGACHLGDSRIAELVEVALRHFHRERYGLRAWCVMPNHVHVLLVQLSDLGKIVGSWKSFVARRANQLLRRNGSFWAPDYWDTFMRDEEQAIRVTKYIEENPLKAGLVKDAAEFRWGSARLRNTDGGLKL